MPILGSFCVDGVGRREGNSRTRGMGGQLSDAMVPISFDRIQRAPFS